MKTEQHYKSAYGLDIITEQLDNFWTVTKIRKEKPFKKFNGWEIKIKDLKNNAFSKIILDDDEKLMYIQKEGFYNLLSEQAKAKFRVLIKRNLKKGYQML